MIQNLVIVAFLSSVVSFTSAWKIQGWKYQAQEAEAIQTIAQADRENKARENKLSEGFEQEKLKIQSQIKTVNKTRERVIEKPIYRNVCFDDDGLQLVKQAISGNSNNNTSKPKATMP